MRWQVQACSTSVSSPRRRRGYMLVELISLIIHRRDAIFSWNFVKSWLSEVGNAINLCGIASRKNPLRNSKSQFEVFWPKKGLEDLWRIEAQISILWNFLRIRLLNEMARPGMTDHRLQGTPKACIYAYKAHLINYSLKRCDFFVKFCEILTFRGRQCHQFVRYRLTKKSIEKSQSVNSIRSG